MMNFGDDAAFGCAVARACGNSWPSRVRRPLFTTASRVLPITREGDGRVGSGRLSPPSRGRACLGQAPAARGAAPAWPLKGRHALTTHTQDVRGSGADIQLSDEQIVAAYQRGSTLAALSEEAGKAISTVRSIIVAAGIEIRKPGVRVTTGRTQRKQKQRAAYERELRRGMIVRPLTDEDIASLEAARRRRRSLPMPLWA